MAAEEALLKRVLPQNMEAEQAVVGSMIMDKEAISVASEMLTGDDFYSKQYGVVFDTMVELNDQGKAVDPVTLQDRLRAKDVPPEMVSLDFIRDIMRSVTTSANVKYYAGIVAEKSTLRKLISLNQEIENTCYAGKEDLEVILESTEKKVFELVKEYLAEDGVFIFDLNTVHKYRDLMGECTISENREESSFIWENYFYEDEMVNEYDLTLFIREESDLYRKYEELHYQKAYELEQVKELLLQAGMEFVAAYDAFTHDPVTAESERMYIIARPKVI